MSYITDTDIERRLGSIAYVQLTDDVGTGSANAEVVAEARDGAIGEVNSYLGRRFRVPINVTQFPELAALLATVTLDIVVHRLHARRPPIPPDVAKQYASAVSWLAKVAAGTADLPSAGVLPGVDNTGVVGAVRGNEAILSKDELERL